MTAVDRMRWNSRYAIAESSFKPQPPELFDKLGFLPTEGRALDIACGRGACSVWLAQRGLQVDAVDISDIALQSAARLASDHGVQQRLRLWPHDLDEGLPHGLGDGFAVIICQRFREPRLYPLLNRLLAPHGLLAITVLSSVGGRAGRFCAEPGELLSAFGSLQVLAHRETCGEAALLARAPLHPQVQATPQSASDS